MIKKLVLLTIIISLGEVTLSQKSFHLSQYMMHQPFINPASISSYMGLNGAIVHRSQWVGFTGAPTVQGLSVNSPIKNGNNSIGLTILHDKIGVNRDISIAGKYAYKFKVDENSFFSLGIDAKLRMLKSELETVEVNDINDNVFSANTPTFMSPNFGFGMYYFKNRFYAGFSVPNILNNKIEFNQAYEVITSFNANELHYYLHSGYKFILNKKLNVNSSMLLKAVTGSPLQADVNAQLEINNKFGVGVSYRTSKEIIALVSFNVMKQIKIAYAYDYSLSEIAKFSSGSHEVMLLLDFYEPKTQAIIDIPRF